MKPVNFISHIIISMLAILFLLTWNSCEKDVILELADEEGRYIIVEANLTNDGDLQWIRLTQSSSYYDVNRGIGLKGASVIIEEEDDLFLFSEAVVDSVDGFYLQPQISKKLRETTYRLQITTEDQKTYTAQSTFRPVPELDSVTVQLNPFSELGIFEERVYDIFAHFRDLPDEGNFYLFNLYINNQLKTGRPNDKAPMSDINLEEYVSYAVLSVNERDVNPGDTLTLEIRSISRENFNFYSAFFFQTDLSGNPFAGAPPANIPTNLSQGARGFFQVSAVNKKTIIFERPRD